MVESQPVQDAIVKELNLIKSELQSMHENLRRLTAQKSENESVLKEFEVLEDDAVVWKMTGPLMVKQDRGEANENVSKRLDFIKLELEKLEEGIKTKETVFESKREELVKMQSNQQASAVVS